MYDIKKTEEQFPVAFLPYQESFHDQSGMFS